jgi:cation transport protein ChaC
MTEADPDPLWVFGYGSLVWRPAFPYADRQPAFLAGWARRFWQGSTDHRGVPGAPGRVVTLVGDAAEACWGVAYRVAPGDRRRVLAQLDHREKGGYERLAVELGLRTGRAVSGLTYLATARNPNYLGPAPLEQIAEQVRRSAGPSGPNHEYVTRLADALRSLGASDDHVFSLERLLASQPTDQGSPEGIKSAPRAGRREGHT